jgi:hypothetical protein
MRTPRLTTARISQLVCDLEKLNAETAQTLERIEALLARAKGRSGPGTGFGSCSRRRTALPKPQSLAGSA